MGSEKQQKRPVKTNEDRINVVYAVTADYIEKIWPSVASLKEHNPKVNIYVVTEVDKVKGCKTINVKEQTIFPPEGVNYGNYFTYINLMKVCYPSILPCDKVIHLDADTIICDSLKPLWDIDLTGKWFAACKEIQNWYKPFGDDYYNMGVAVINLAQMRKDKTELDMVEYLNNVLQPWADQDAWNKYGIKRDKIVPFDTRYNESNATGTTGHPAIVHYCGYGNWWDGDVPRREFLDKYKRISQ